MWKSLKTLVEVIAELPNNDCLAPQAMPQSHYLNSQRDFVDDVMLLLPPTSKNQKRQPNMTIDDSVAILGQLLQT